MACCGSHDRNKAKAEEYREKETEAKRENKKRRIEDIKNIWKNGRKRERKNFFF
jgi:hypothetical protein